MSRSLRRPRSLVATLAAVVCLTTAVSTGTASAAPPATEVASGADWTVTRVAGGFQVTLHLGRQLPVTASAPTLSADGSVLGPATESADGRSLSLVTADPSVVTAGSVTTDAFGSPSARRTAGAPRTAMPPVTAETLRTDPSTPGPYRVAEATYDFGDLAVPLLNIGACAASSPARSTCRAGTAALRS